MAAPAGIGWPLRRRLLAGLLLAALFAWLALRPPPGPASDPRLIERDIFGMGTLISISVYLDAGYGADRAEAALADLEGFLRAFESQWSAWGDGELGRLNQGLARGEAVDIPGSLQPLFARAAMLSAASGGAFDPRIGALVRLWGFHDAAHYRKTPPADDAIQQLVADLQAAPPLAPEALRYGPAPAVQFDFGAIAKGWAADRAIERLREAGIGNAIVNAGGNLAASGRRGARPWRIGIRHPRADAPRTLLATLEIAGQEAVITSGDYERWFEHAGRRYHHILDPHGGYPPAALQSVTVVHGDGALADAASTALFVAGTRWREAAQALALDQVLVVDAAGRLHATKRLAPRLRLEPGLRLEALP